MVEVSVVSFLLIALAVWIAPAVLIGLYLAISLLRANPVPAHQSSDQQHHALDDRGPENSTHADDRQIASPLRAENMQVRSESHVSPVA